MCARVRAPPELWASCGTGCVAKLCSPQCIFAHRKACSTVSFVSVDVFGPKIFNNLFFALAQVACVCADVADDVFAPVAVFVPSGKTLLNKPGRKARSVRRPLGEHGGSFKHLIKSDNTSVFRQADRAVKCLVNGRFIFWIADAMSFAWLFPTVDELSKRESMLWDSVAFKFLQSTETFWILHNAPLLTEELCSQREFSAASPDERWPAEFFRFFSIILKKVAAQWCASQLPIAPALQHAWVLNALRNSTKGLQRPGFAADAASHVLRILQTMRQGKEAEHLRNLVNLVDLRGSDVRLETRSVCESSRQSVPYPAVAWKWRCIQSYSWQSAQHINVLELIAFLNYYKCMSAYTVNSHLRFFHIFDSRVCSCVIAKGRSSSRVLNRILRRVASLLLASDAYVLPLWTISAWIFSDSGSRVLTPALSLNDAG